VGKCATQLTKCEQNGGYCTHFLDTCKTGYVGGPPMDCPMGKSGQCCLPDVSLTTDETTYVEGDTIAASLVNNTLDSIFLSGCSVLSWERLENGTWTNQGPDKVCFWEGFASELKAGATYSESLSTRGVGTWRLSAGYGIGCDPGKPLSQANCKVSTTVTSAAFTVETATTCKPTGCSGQICSDKDVFTTCEWLPWYACYKKSECGNFGPNGTCAWKHTAAYLACMAQVGPQP
jgi:eight-cysteine-cluster-containing protein